MDAPSEKKTTSDLFSSATVVAGAAQAYFQSDTDKVEKGKVAGAAADLLGAASDYGKLEEKGYGEYVEKAETYLQQYGTTGASAPAAEAATAPAPAPAPAPAAAPADAGEEAPADAGEEAKSEEGGQVEGLAKMAKGLFGGVL